jgi:hypothetical protein
MRKYTRKIPHPSLFDYGFCCDCRRWFPVKKFHNDNLWCASCNTRRWIASHWYDHVAMCHRYQSKAIFKDKRGDFTADDLHRLILKYGKYCFKCGTVENITIDHIQARALGGSNRIENIQLLCKVCNNLKHLDTVDYRPKKRQQIKLLSDTEVVLPSLFTSE